MKKLIIFNSFAILVFFLLSVNIDDIRSFSTDWIIVSMLVPIATGLITVLLQDKNKSYDYLPALLYSSVFFSLAAVFFGQFRLYFTDELKVPFSSYINPFFYEGLDDTLVLFAMYFGGGLLGIAIKGVNQVFFPKHKFRLNLNIPFSVSFLIGVVVLLVANIYYVLISIPPDGRWKIEIPVTSLFIILYLAMFFLISKKLIKNQEKNYLLWVYNVFLSLVFISNAIAVRVAFQDFNWQYLQFIATAPYLIILGLGIICYIPLALFLEKKASFFN
jgi:hypothetical protein